MSKLLLNFDEAMKEIGISRSFGYAEVRRRKLEIVKVGDATRVTPEACRAYVEARVAESRAAAAAKSAEAERLRDAAASDDKGAATAPASPVRKGRGGYRGKRVEASAA